MQAQVSIQDIYYIPSPAPDSESYYLTRCTKQLVSLAKISQETAAEIVQMTIVHGGQIVSPLEEHRERCNAPQHWILPDWYADWVPLRTVPALVLGKKEAYWALREAPHPRMEDKWYLIVAE